MTPTNEPSGRSSGNAVRGAAKGGGCQFGGHARPGGKSSALNKEWIVGRADRRTPAVSRAVRSVRSRHRHAGARWVALQRRGGGPYGACRSSMTS